VLAALPENQARAVELHYLKSCPVAIVAEELGCSKAAVAGLLHRGLQNLRDRLEESGGDLSMSEPDPAASREQRLNEALLTFLEAAEAGQKPDHQDWLTRYPDLAAELTDFFANQKRLAELSDPIRSAVAEDNAAPPAEQATRAPERPDRPQPAAGERLPYFGDYELIAEIARGGMGVVYKARQVSLNRLVALKMILAGQLAGEKEVQRFYAEAQIAANLQHPHIVAVHEVGEHEGQHYFSMDLVEGPSLAELIRDNTLEPKRAARYIKVVADAIQYAHEQGKLHRDLKPSNILIDALDRPRVTDFGLARRTEVDARLTASGTVLGTPSYLPPEQASGQRGRIGPHSDVYSLGAMLYELVTGRPPFRAATPIDTILQVLSTPPLAPRLLNPKIDRNLETILLKCLAKEPAERYATARDLAEDLQSYFDGRPIKARRPGRVERAGRWLRRHRRALNLTAATAAVTALIVAGGFLAWQASRSKSVAEPVGHMMLTTAGEPLIAEAVDDEDKALAKRFTVPTAEAQTVPPGCYRFRFTARGHCSETYRTWVGTQFNAQGNVTLEERHLWPPIEIQREETAEVVDLGGHADVVTAGPSGVRRFDGRSGKLVWDKKFGDRRDPLLGEFGKITQADQQERVRQNQPLQIHWSSNPRSQGIQLLSGAPDLDGDGVPDLLWSTSTGNSSAVHTESPCILALSGKTGKALWFYIAEQASRKRGLPYLLGLPAIVRDAGNPMVLVTYLVNEDFLIVNGRGQFRNAIWVEALAAKTGKPLWRSPVRKWTDAKQFFDKGVYGVHARFRGSQHQVDVVAGGFLATLDLEVGKLVSPVQRLPKGIKGTVQFIAGIEPGILLVTDGSFLYWSIRKGKEVWRKPLPPSRWNRPGWQMPVLVDLAGDGKTAIALTQDMAQRTDGSVGVAVLDPGTGSARWVHESVRLANGGKRHALRFIVGPAKRDGTRDLFTAVLTESFDSETAIVEVEALSGRTGRGIWKRLYRRPHHHQEAGWDTIATLYWWQPGEDGHPQLVICRGNPLALNPDHSPDILVVSATTGQLRHVVSQFGVPEVADLNGDGIPDLYVRRDDKLHALAGRPAESWRWMQGHWTPVRRRDGLAPELIGPWSGGSLLFISGNDGRFIRRTRLRNVSELITPAHIGWSYRTEGTYLDLDGDGVEDLAALAYDPEGRGLLLHIISGRTGEVICRPSLAAGKKGFGGWMLPLAQDLLGDGRPELVCVYKTQAYGSKGDAALRTNYTLAVFSGSNGQVRWQQPLLEKAIWHELPGEMRFVPGVGDLNGDGIKDVVTWAVGANDRHEIRAFSGKDGRLLWSHLLDSANEAETSRKIRLRDTSQLPVDLVDLDGNGKLQVVVLRPDMHAVGNSGREYRLSCEVLVLEGQDGKLRWSHKLPARGFNEKGDPAPLLLPSAAGYRIAVLTTSTTGRGDRAQVVVLDHTGAECGRAPVAAPRWQGDFSWDDSVRLLPKGRLLLIGSGQVHLWQGGLERLRWSWPLPKGLGRIITVLPPGPKQPETVVVHAGAVVYGLHAGTGKPMWTCKGPGRCTYALPTAKGLPKVLFEVIDPKNAVNLNTICIPGVPLKQE
jgi:outer membrane protein assembly factor BamB/tRNA A-37 threonylcarbamoyl transferase component Bud32